MVGVILPPTSLLYMANNTLLKIINLLNDGHYFSISYPFQKDISELSGLSLVIALATCSTIAATVLACAIAGHYGTFMSLIKNYWLVAKTVYTPLFFV
jgi:hypothetical protein